MAEQAEKKKSGGKGFLIVLVILLLLGNLAQGYFNYKQHTDGTVLTDSLSNKKTELAETVEELDILEADLQATKDTLEARGVEITQINELLETVRAERDRAVNARSGDLATIRSLRSNLSQYKKMFLQMEEEINQLKKTTALQDTLITELKVEQVALKDTITGLEENVVDLEEDVRKGKKLVASDFGIVAVKSNGKEKVKEIYKSKDLANMKVTFSISENKIADIGNKAVYVQIVDPSGNTIYDLSGGGGEFEVDGSSMFYTQKQDVGYDRSKKELTVNYSRGADYDSGTHYVNVYSDGFKIGSGSFQVK